MKVLHVNAADVEGGAARAATWLTQGLCALGVDASLQVQRKRGDSPLVRGPGSLLARAISRARPTLEQLAAGIEPERIGGPFSAALLPEGVSGRINGVLPDIVHLHWVARMMRLESLRRIRAPLVWTLHDSWPFTGGCYLPGDCTRYRHSCGNCPVLASPRENDLSRRIWRRKEKAWRGLNLTIVAPSKAMAEAARSSSLLRDACIEVIPNGLDVGRFRPLEKRAAREFFSLPQGKKLILFGAKGATTDRNKGFHLLAEALRKLPWPVAARDSAELVVFGSDPPENPPETGFKTRYLGWQQDDSLAALYSAADVFVLPSLQESLGYTAMESMACGTPCIAFNQGGVPDLIDHLSNGYLAEPYEPADLARGIALILEDGERREKMGGCARDKVVAEYALEKVAQRHLGLYRDVLSGETARAGAARVQRR